MLHDVEGLEFLKDCLLLLPKIIKLLLLIILFISWIPAFFEAIFVLTISQAGLKCKVATLLVESVLFIGNIVDLHCNIFLQRTFQLNLFLLGRSSSVAYQLDIMLPVLFDNLRLKDWFLLILLLLL